MDFREHILESTAVQDALRRASHDGTLLPALSDALARIRANVDTAFSSLLYVYRDIKSEIRQKSAQEQYSMALSLMQDGREQLQHLLQALAAVEFDRRAAAPAAFEGPRKRARDHGDRGDDVDMGARRSSRRSRRSRRNRKSRRSRA